jgi:hypothetical protein
MQIQCPEERPDAGNGGRAFALCATDQEKPMSERLQRMLEKARAKRGRRRASETILIACERPEDVPRRVDVLIAAGKLTEADRARCVFWPDDWDGTPDQWVLMMDKNMTPEDLRRQRVESAERARAAALADPVLAAAYAKKEKSENAAAL